MRVYTQREGIFICGKIKEVRLLLSEYNSRYRTIREMIMELFN